MAASLGTTKPLDWRGIALVAALVALTALAWIDLALMAADPDSMASPRAWTPGYAAAMLAMWAIMMAAMMVPSAAPTILLFAALRRHAGRGSAMPTALFVAGYLAAWTAFSAAATLVQWLLATSSLLSPAMASESPRLAGALLVAAGAYQFSGTKHACLTACRAPARFLVEHHREGLAGAFAMGVEHGAYCIGCCAVLMALLFAFGVMNLAWVLALSALVLVEKVFPAGPWFARATGVALAAAGVAFLLIN
jgi:predicted metal-binding membrane protein